MQTARIRTQTEPNILVLLSFWVPTHMHSLSNNARHHVLQHEYLSWGWGGKKRGIMVKSLHRHLWGKTDIRAVYGRKGVKKV